MALTARARRCAGIRSEKQLMECCGNVTHAIEDAQGHEHPNRWKSDRVRELPWLPSHASAARGACRRRIQQLSFQLPGISASVKFRTIRLRSTRNPGGPPKLSHCSGGRSSTHLNVYSKIQPRSVSTGSLSIHSYVDKGSGFMERCALAAWIASSRDVMLSNLRFFQKNFTIGTDEQA